MFPVDPIDHAHLTSLYPLITLSQAQTQADTTRSTTACYLPEDQVACLSDYIYLQLLSVSPDLMQVYP